MADRSIMNISLPAAMKAWVDREVERGQFGTASEYVRHLIRQARAQSAGKTIDQQLLEGLDSGRTTRMTKADWEDVRREGRRRLARTRRKSA